ncbi:hypothetical protein CSKR_104773 [Clonorchis sinensis]|uniref:Uncharacterized protein n=1 Tax=Clonorchis sinensis TaxID=79923 RepID=A0A419PLM5_CLOSI|nr:hypothetical protein CSKR_104773 [Clonorchis sinensis]
MTGRSVVRTRPLPLDFPCLGLDNLVVSQPSCFIRMAWELGTERMLQLNNVLTLGYLVTCRIVPHLFGAQLPRHPKEARGCGYCPVAQAYTVEVEMQRSSSNHGPWSH